MLQGRYGVTNWRRQIRLEAYVSFTNATHDFNNALGVAVRSYDSPDFDQQWQKIRDYERDISRLGSMLMIVGPPSVFESAGRVGLAARRIIQEGNNRDTFSAIARSVKEGSDYERRDRFGDAAYDFAIHCRKVLRTEEFGPLMRRPKA